MARIVIVSPARAGIITGNSVTAERWQKLLRSLGHRVVVRSELGRERCDVLVALHATKSAASVREAVDRGGIRIVVALTGTDVYQDLPRFRKPWESLERADRIVLLQPLGMRELPAALRRKAVVIRQSVRMPRPALPRSKRFFDVVVLSNFRPVKDPLRAAYAARLLPASSRIRVIHAGEALDQGWAKRAQNEMRRNRRYVWKGELTRGQARRLLARGNLLVLSSRSEGGANVLSEAIVAGVPVLASDIPGNVGLLGRSYPGLFGVKDTERLVELMYRAENDVSYYEELCTQLSQLRPLFHPKREQSAWKELIESISEQD